MELTGIQRANSCCQVKAVVVDSLCEALLDKMLSMPDSAAMIDWLVACEAEDLKLPLSDYFPLPESVASLAGVTKREVLSRYARLSPQSMSFSRFASYLANRLKPIQQAELAATCSKLASKQTYERKMPKPRHYAPTYT